jgi:hypothetical protein
MYDHKERTQFGFSGRPTTGRKQNIGPYLLVSRETGAGGSEIAKRVAHRLCWELLDKEILEALESNYGTPAAVLDVVDEKKPSWLTDLFNGWIEGHGFSQLTYVHRLHRVFDTAAQRGNVVIVGRGARFILPRWAGLFVRIIAPLEFRVEQIILRKGLSAAKAREFVEHSDRERIAFVKRYFHQNLADPHIYDLVLNVEQFGQGNAVDLISHVVQSWLKRSGLGAESGHLQNPVTRTVNQ